MHLQRLSTPQHLNTSQAPLIVETRESRDEVTVAPADMRAECLYSARVENDDNQDAIDVSVINLCHGMYGMLALHDGVYLLEPMQNSTDNGHLLFRAPTHHFVRDRLRHHRKRNGGTC